MKDVLKSIRSRLHRIWLLRAGDEKKYLRLVGFLPDNDYWERNFHGFPMDDHQHGSGTFRHDGRLQHPADEVTERIEHRVDQSEQKE